MIWAQQLSQTKFCPRIAIRTKIKKNLFVTRCQTWTAGACNLYSFFQYGDENIDIASSTRLGFDSEFMTGFIPYVFRNNGCIIALLEILGFACLHTEYLPVSRHCEFQFWWIYAGIIRYARRCRNTWDLPVAFISFWIVKYASKDIFFIATFTLNWDFIYIVLKGTLDKGISDQKY